MKSFMDRIKRWIFFWRKPEVTKPSIRSRHKKETFGAYYYLDNILDTLSDYFDAINLMRRIDADAFDYYSKVGGQIVSRSSLFDMTGLPPVWLSRESRPAMGMVHITDTKKDDGDNLHASFLSFKKIKRRPGVETCTDADIYEIALYFRDYEFAKIVGDKKLERYRRAFIRKYGDKNKGAILRMGFYASLDGNCKIRVLKEFDRELRGHRRDIPSCKWKLPPWIEDYAKYKNTSIIDAASEIFRIVAGSIEHAASGVQVRAKRDGISAIFNVDMLRTPYFFKDRDKTVNVNGRTKRIFHITRAHRRITAAGNEVYVKSHFRGERRFTWNGYQITISMPGLHHSILQRMGFSAFDTEDKEIRGEDILYAPQFGEEVDAHLGG